MYYHLQSGNKSPALLPGPDRDPAGRGVGAAVEGDELAHGRRTVLGRSKTQQQQQWENLWFVFGSLHLCSSVVCFPTTSVIADLALLGLV